MNGSNNLEESNRRPMFSCPICLHKLKSSLGFDLKERYQALLEFCRLIDDENFEGACCWLEKAIEKFSWQFSFCIDFLIHEAVFV